MPLLLDTLRPGPAVDLRGRNCLTIGLVNNMPDAACEATERQFLKLLRAASSDVVVLLKLFSIAAVPRSEATRADLAGRYRDIAELWSAPLDGLIVTGTEPIAADLKDEPYWNAACDLVDWACTNTISAVWSCLAAHAAVLYADGIARQRLAGKLSGVFDCEAAGAHPLLAGMVPLLRVPHSRLNDLPQAGLLASGYRVLTRSPRPASMPSPKSRTAARCLSSFKVILNTTRIRFCANTAATSAVSCAARPVPIRKRRRIISAVPRRFWRTISARAPPASSTAIWSAIFPCGRSPPGLKTPGAAAPSASTGTGSNT
jgi:Homoserine O-succinyltransferase